MHKGITIHQRDPFIWIFPDGSPGNPQQRILTETENHNTPSPYRGNRNWDRPYYGRGRGGGIVILKIEDYYEELDKLVQDKETYEKLKSNPLPKYRNKCKKTLKESAQKRNFK